MDGSRKKEKHSSLLEGAKSVLSVGFNYNSSQNNNKNKIFKVGKFSQGEDYHKVIYKKLKNIGRWINLEIPDCKWKNMRRHFAASEKAWAEESGIGWIGKNSNLINKKHGSWFTLGFMILTQDLLPDKPHQSLCGKCDKCIEKCPTKAIVEPFVIQSNSCIAYHTIESRENNSKRNKRKFKWMGCIRCDICQDVCPWNKSVPTNDTYETTPKEWIRNLNIDSLSWDNTTWEKHLKGTTLKKELNHGCGKEI